MVESHDVRLIKIAHAPDNKEEEDRQMEAAIKLGTQKTEKQLSHLSLMLDEEMSVSLHLEQENCQNVVAIDELMQQLVDWEKTNQWLSDELTKCQTMVSAQGAHKYTLKQALLAVFDEDQQQTSKEQEKSSAATMGL
ncbi:hypothetical protein L208DRAFT_1377265 [Tricholoma matsutake]|nr:hypothetical protein L208DRAFT_1377265 [Tricholoma matsutake 945]